MKPAKRKPGRPRRYGAQLHVSATPSTIRTLKLIARESKMTMPEVIEYLLRLEEACVQHAAGVLGA